MTPCKSCKTKMACKKAGKCKMKAGKTTKKAPAKKATKRAY